jgi:hypothetical protein
MLAPTGKCDIKTDRQIRRRRIDTAHGRWSAEGISLSKQVKAPMLATVNTKRMLEIFYQDSLCEWPNQSTTSRVDKWF